MGDVARSAGSRGRPSPHCLFDLTAQLTPVAERSQVAFAVEPRELQTDAYSLVLPLLGFGVWLLSVGHSPVACFSLGQA